MKLSIVSTLYHSAPFVEDFCRRAGQAARALAGDDYEIVLVNDGSPDESHALAIAQAEADRCIVVVDLSRNFGHHKAMMTGLMQARGDLIFLIDSDLEEEPEWLGRFHDEMRSSGCDVVYGVQEKRRGTRWDRLTGGWYYRAAGALGGVAIPPNIVTARLMTKRYVEALVQHREREMFMAGLWHATGFEQHPVTVEKVGGSPTTYTLNRKIALLVDTITAFSNRPLVLIFYVGAVIAFLGACFTVYLVVNWLFFSTPPSGWTSVMASLWFIGGLIISFLGVIGVYLAKVYSESKQRPYTIIRDVYRSKGD